MKTYHRKIAAIDGRKLRLVVKVFDCDREVDAAFWGRDVKPSRMAVRVAAWSVCTLAPPWPEKATVGVVRKCLFTDAVHEAFHIASSCVPNCRTMDTKNLATKDLRHADETGEVIPSELAANLCEQIAKAVLCCAHK